MGGGHSSNGDWHIQMHCYGMAELADILVGSANQGLMKDFITREQLQIIANNDYNVARFVIK